MTTNINKFSAWSSDFLVQIKAALEAMQHAPWYEALVEDFHKKTQGDEIIPYSARLSDSAKQALDAFLARFTHIKFAKEAHLSIEGSGHFWGGQLYLCLPMAPCELPTPEALWELKVFAWASDQFCRLWHACYGKCELLQGKATDLKKELARCDFSDRFFTEMSDWSEEQRNKFMEMDFSPRVIEEKEGFKIVYYLFTSFGGIYRRVARLKGKIQGECVVEYNCGVQF